MTQATVSRDIRELKLTKVALNSGRQKYVALNETSEDLTGKYTRVFREGFVSMDMAQNILDRLRRYPVWQWRWRQRWMHMDWS